MATVSEVVRELVCGACLPVDLREYGCVWCQAYHREGDPLFGPHLVAQSKHGVRDVDVYTAIVEAAAKTA